MSSMRNAAPRRSHRERAQPQARSKWGLLEKHKDYSLRAADYNQKKKKLNILSQKSKEKNPDEFAFGMLSADKVKAGKHGSSGTKNRLDHDVVEKLKAQDSGYLRTILGRNRKEIEKVKEEIGLDDVLKRRGTAVEGKENEQKLMFDEDGQPLRKRIKRTFEDVDLDIGSEIDEDIDDFHSALDGDEHRGVDRSFLAQETDDSDDALSQPKVKTKRQKILEAEMQARRQAEKRRRKKIREARAAKLEILKKRQKSIMTAASELELQRAKMAKTIGGTNKNGVTFKVRERKR